MKVKHIFFDLDGTLLDSKQGIIGSLNYMFEKIGDGKKPEQELMKFVGPPLSDSLSKYYGYTEEKNIRARKIFEEDFLVNGIFNATPFEGVIALLQELRQMDVKVFVATMKPDREANICLNGQHMLEMFDGIAGADLFKGGANRKELVIRKILDRDHIDPQTAMMVGDRGSDIYAANYLGMVSVAAFYGYGERKELEEQNPKYGAESVQALRDIILKLV